MYPTLFATTFVFALAALRVRADFNVDTVEFTQCKPVTLNWAKTDGPYNVIIVPSSEPCGDFLVDLGDHDSNQFDWSKVNITAGTKVMISVLDNKDDEGWSGVITVKSSDDKSCLSSGDNPNYPSPSASDPANPPGSSPTPTVVGAANAGKLGSGASALRFSGAAVAFTALGVLAVLL